MDAVVGQDINPLSASVLCLEFFNFIKLWSVAGSLPYCPLHELKVITIRVNKTLMIKYSVGNPLSIRIPVR